MSDDRFFRTQVCALCRSPLDTADSMFSLSDLWQGQNILN